MKNFFRELFSILSRLLNVITGGTADITFSARSHIDGLWTEDLIDWVFWTIFREEEHCRVWWEVEVARSKVNLDRADAIWE